MGFGYRSDAEDNYDEESKSDRERMEGYEDSEDTETKSEYKCGSVCLVLKHFLNPIEIARMGMASKTCCVTKEETEKGRAETHVPKPVLGMVQGRGSADDIRERVAKANFNMNRESQWMKAKAEAVRELESAGDVDKLAPPGILQ